MYYVDISFMHQTGEEHDWYRQTRRQGRKLVVQVGGVEGGLVGAIDTEHVETAGLLRLGLVPDERNGSEGSVGCAVRRTREHHVARVVGRPAFSELGT